MKLRNKKTGEIVEKFPETIVINTGSQIYTYSSLAELNEDWEDYKEPKDYWCITGRGNLHYLQDITDENDKDHREIGNYFETKEEAERAVEKLKAWKRLKDKGFRLTEWYKPDGCEPFIVIETNIDNDDIEDKGLLNDLDLLFSEEDD